MNINYININGYYETNQLIEIIILYSIQYYIHIKMLI